MDWFQLDVTHSKQTIKQCIEKMRWLSSSSINIEPSKRKQNKTQSKKKKNDGGHIKIAIEIAARWSVA